MKFTMLIILILLLCYINTTGQIEPFDSSHAKITLNELKYITAKFVEVNYLRAVGLEQKKEIGIYKNLVMDKDGIINIQKDQISLLNQQIEDQRPAWWNKFTWGAAGAVSVVLLIVLLIK